MKNFYNLNLLVLTITLTGPIASWASTIKTFNVFKKSVSFNLGDDWQSVNKEIGVPLKLIGPEHESSRPVITLTPIDLKDEVIKLDNADEAELSYKTSRMAWLQKFNGSAISFEPLKVYEANKNKVHVFGFSYAFNNENYSEKSFYVECDKKIFHIKTLIKLEHLGKWGDEVEKITKSFQCK